MPRRKALPEELDPQMREFVYQLRRLVDRGGMSLATLADRTGYSRTSWERYLNGRLLAPKGAVVALAEVTGTPQHHLTAMWEPAERAWSRSEMRHDMTMEAIRISQARTAPGEAGVSAAPVASRRTARGCTGARAAAGPRGAGREVGRPPSVPARRGAVPRVPPQPGSAPDSVTGPLRTAGGTGGRREGGRNRVLLVLTGLVGALTLMAGAVLLTGPGGDDDAGAAAPAPSAEPVTRAPALPAGVGCGGADCTGRDPEAMGCGGRFAGTVARVAVGGGLVEVRHSETCGAAWARLTRASLGDTVRITSGASEQAGTVRADAEAYTPMVAVEKASDARACATLASGATGCTTPE
ncbi:helix-turn-helix domain-containing protein [Streptomyces sp. ALB3]|uniref:helix-turn-helix domain-containing protein n=1 Tax=Streptomyces sp. ALB3 TaxID=3374278 RepID=UPI0037BD5CA0